MELNRTQLLPPNDLRDALHVRHHFVARVANDTTLEQILTPAYWAHHWQKFQVPGHNGERQPLLGALIEVFRHDLSLDVMLRVIGVGPGYVSVRPIYQHVDNAGLKARADQAAADGAVSAALVLPDGYKWFHAPNGAAPGHGIRNTITGDTVVKGKATKAEAIAAAIALHRQATADPAPPAPATPPAPSSAAA